MDLADEGAALCAPFLLHLPVDGVAISVMSQSGTQSTVGTSDNVATTLEELQFRLGEGPTFDAMRHGLFISALDLEMEDARNDWPMFAAAAAGIGVRALFAFPMLVAGIRVGVVNLYALAVRPLWTAALMQHGAALTSATAPLAVELATRAARSDQQDGPRQIGLRREVHQVAGMLMVQLHCSIDEAITRLRAHAFATGDSVDVVAQSVVRGSLLIGPLDD